MSTIRISFTYKEKWYIDDYFFYILRLLCWLSSFTSSSSSSIMCARSIYNITNLKNTVVKFNWIKTAFVQRGALSSRLGVCVCVYVVMHLGVISLYESRSYILHRDASSFIHASSSSSFSFFLNPIRSNGSTPANLFFGKMCYPKWHLFRSKCTPMCKRAVDLFMAYCYLLLMGHGLCQSTLFSISGLDWWSPSLSLYFSVNAQTDKLGPKKCILHMNKYYVWIYNQLWCVDLFVYTYI